MLLVTGATGFLGRHLIPSLAKEGHKIRCLVRKESDISVLKKHGVDIAYGDITDRNSIAVSLKDVDTIIHLAAVLDSSDKRIREVNVNGAMNLVNASKNNIKKIIVLSSAVANKDSDLMYPKTKSIADDIFLSSGLNCLVIRPTWIYGNGSRSFSKLVTTVKKMSIVPIIGNGKVRMQPVYVDDVTRLISTLISAKKPRHKIYYIGGSEELTFNDMVDRICDSLGAKKRRIHIPLFFVKLALGLAQTASLSSPISKDFLSDTTQDIVVDNLPLKEEFGLVPMGFKEGMGILNQG